MYLSVCGTLEFKQYLFVSTNENFLTILKQKSPRPLLLAILKRAHHMMWLKINIIFNALTNIDINYSFSTICNRVNH
jgi:hypothetical protein